MLALCCRPTLAWVMSSQRGPPPAAPVSDPPPAARVPDPPPAAPAVCVSPAAGMVDCAQKTVKMEGIAGLYKVWGMARGVNRA